MSLYRYHTVDRKRGRIEAASLSEAKMRLRGDGILITRVKELRRPHRATLHGEALVSFTFQLAQLVRSGLPIFESLRALTEQYRSERFYPILTRICDAIAGGKRLSVALAEHPQSFGQLYCAMIAAGEAAGTLDSILDKLAKLLSRGQKLRASLRTALLYPATIAIFCTGVVILLLTFAVPAIEQLFEGRQISTFTRLVLGTSHLLSRCWPLLLVLPIPAALFVRRLPLKRWALHFPLIGPILIQASLARFCRTLGTLLEGGVTTLEALRLARPVMLCPELEAAMERVEGQVVQGKRLSDELKKEKWVPPLMIRMLAVGEEGGSVAPMLNNIADLYEEDLEKRLTRLVTLAQPIILIVMGALIGMIMLAVLLPLTDVSGLL